MKRTPNTSVSFVVAFASLLFSCNSEMQQSTTETRADKTKPQVQIIQKTKEPAQRDRSITVENSFNNMFLDSSVIHRFLSKQNLTDDEKQQVLDFYTVRNDEYAWFDSTGMNEQALNFMSANRSFTSLLDRKDLQNDSLNR